MNIIQDFTQISKDIVNEIMPPQFLEDNSVLLGQSKILMKEQPSFFFEQILINFVIIIFIFLTIMLELIKISYVKLFLNNLKM